MGAYGFTGIERAIVPKSFRARQRFPNWRWAGERDSGTADYYRLYRRPRRSSTQVTPALRDDVTNFEHQITASTTRAARPGAYGVGHLDSVYGLHDQAMASRACATMAGVWAETGHALAREPGDPLADRLEAGLRAAVQPRRRRLPDGSLFVPVVLLDAREAVSPPSRSPATGATGTW